MKKTTLCFYFVLVLFICSCAKKDSLNLIPKDAHGVFTCNFKNILDKGNLENIESYDFTQKLYELIGEESKKFAEFYKQTLDDPQSTGIDLRKNIYGFFINSEENKYVCVLADLIQDKTFEEKLVEILAEAETEYEITKEKGNKICTITIKKEEKEEEKNLDNESTEEGEENVEDSIDGKIYICWNNNNLIFTIPTKKEFYDKAEEYALGILGGKDNNLAVNNKNFADFISKEKDMGGWYSFNSIPEEKQNKIEEKIKAEINDCYAQSILLFDKQETKYEVSLELNDELKEKLKLDKLFKKGVSDKILANAPRENMYSLSIALNPETIKEIAEYLKMTEGVDDNLGKADIELADVVESLNGNILIGLTNLNVKMVETEEYNWSTNRIEMQTKPKMNPEFYGILEFNNDLIFNKIKEISMQTGMVKQENNYYSVKPGKMPIYFGYTSDLLMVTNNDTLINDFSSNTIASNLQGSEQYQEYTNNSIYLFSEMNMKSMPKSMKEMAKENMGEDLFNKLAEKDIEGKYSLSLSNDYVLTLKSVVENDIDNTLSFMLEIIDDISEEKFNIE